MLEYAFYNVLTGFSNISDVGKIEKTLEDNEVCWKTLEDIGRYWTDIIEDRGYPSFERILYVVCSNIFLQLFY